MAAPLEGIRVIELGVMIAVPGAAHLLACYGAEVIKVEDTAAGDGLRFYGSQKNGMSAWFANANAGKRSIALDLKNEAGRSILWQLIEDADVLIEGFRAGVMDRLGFGYDAVRARRPGIVYCSSSGFGAEGPYADQPVYDPLIQCYSGWAGQQLAEGRPTLVRAMVADKVGAASNAQAITAALVRSARTGQGGHIRSSMLEANVAFVWPDVMMHCSLLDEDADHRPNFLNSYRLYGCADGWVAIAVGTDEQWASMCAALQRPELAGDSRYATGAARSTRMAQWYALMEEMVSGHPVDTVVTRLKAFDVPVAPVLRPEEVAEDAQVRAAGLLVESEHPRVGRIRHPRPAAAMLGEPLTLSPAPSHGQHTAEILAELGYPATEVESLAGQGAVRLSR